MGWFAIYFRQCRIIYAGKVLDRWARGIFRVEWRAVPGAGMRWHMAIHSASWGRVEFALLKGAKCLRVIGQSLEAATIATFELEKHHQHYLVSMFLQFESRNCRGFQRLAYHS